VSRFVVATLRRRSRRLALAFTLPTATLFVTGAPGC